jgi:hypothetical protein
MVDLLGDSAEEIPSLADDEFLRRWQGRTVEELYLKIRRTMPASAPGTLTDRDAVDLVAYVLQANRFAAGVNELAPGAGSWGSGQIGSIR